MKNSFIQFALMGLIFVGCGEAKNDKSTVKASITENSAVEYYSEFVTKMKRTSDSEIKVFSASTFIPQNNISVPVSLEIILFDDGNFDVTYREENGSPAKAILGKWKLKGTQLLIGDLGVGTGATINGSKGIILLMNKDIVMPGLKGKSFKFTI